MLPMMALKTKPLLLSALTPASQRLKQVGLVPSSSCCSTDGYVEDGGGVGAVIFPLLNTQRQWCGTTGQRM